MKFPQSCPTLCDPVDCNLLGFSIHGILQARILEWIAISFSRGSSWPRDQTPVSCIGGRRFNLWATRGAYSPWNSPGQNTMGSLSLLQRIFPTEGSNPGLPHCRWNHKGSPRILEWVACPFSSRSSWPRNQTGVSCFAGGFFTNWTKCAHLSKPLGFYFLLLCN